MNSMTWVETTMIMTGSLTRPTARTECPVQKYMRDARVMTLYEAPARSRSSSSGAETGVSAFL